MKKFLLVLTAVAFTVTNSWALSVIPKIGADLATSVDYDSRPNEDTKAGINLGLEFRGDISNYFSWGAGLEYLFPRGLNDVSGDTDFSFMPLYVSLIVYPLGEWNRARPYIRGNVGYNVVAANDLGDDMTGKLYWGGGIGIEYKNFVYEFSASQFYADFKDPDSLEMRYMKVGFSIGYKISLDNLFKSDEEEEESYE